MEAEGLIRVEYLDPNLAKYKRAEIEQVCLSRARIHIISLSPVSFMHLFSALFLFYILLFPSLLNYLMYK